MFLFALRRGRCFSSFSFFFFSPCCCLYWLALPLLLLFLLFSFPIVYAQFLHAFRCLLWAAFLSLCLSLVSFCCHHIAVSCLLSTCARALTALSLSGSCSLTRANTQRRVAPHTHTHAHTPRHMHVINVNGRCPPAWPGLAWAGCVCLSLCEYFWAISGFIWPIIYYTLSLSTVEYTHTLAHTHIRAHTCTDSRIFTHSFAFFPVGFYMNFSLLFSAFRIQFAAEVCASHRAPFAMHYFIHVIDAFSRLLCILLRDLTSLSLTLTHSAALSRVA